MRPEHLLNLLAYQLQYLQLPQLQLLESQVEDMLLSNSLPLEEFSQESDNANQEITTEPKTAAQLLQGPISSSIPPGQTMEDTLERFLHHLQSRMQRPKQPMPAQEAPPGTPPVAAGDAKAIAKSVDEWFKLSPFESEDKNDKSP